MNILKCKNPTWANAEHTAIEVQVEWQQMKGLLMPFTASSSDTAAHGLDLFNRLVSGEFGLIAEFEG
jgi:hypothetical protein